MTRKTLVVLARNAGFFSNFNCVLNNLEFYLGRDGIDAAEVLWEAPAQETHFSYATPQDGNVWLHYFERLPFEDLSAERVVVSEYPLKWGARYISSVDAYATYKLDPGWRRAYHALYARYIKLQPHIMAQVEALAQAHMAGRYCIGVHYRHPGHSVECLFPIPEPEVFIARVKHFLPHGRAWAVVLASDYQPAVDAFKEAFGDRLMIQSGITRAGATQDQLHHQHSTPGVVLGEQVLVDCLLLSRCDVLLHVTSNVATAAGFINPALKMVYCEAPKQAVLGYFWSLQRVVGWVLPVRWPVPDRLRRPAWLRLSHYIPVLPILRWFREKLPSFRKKDSRS